MKRVFSLALVAVSFLFVVACEQKAPTWQEQYDLGVRYLSEGNYEEAIIAFTAAIEIDSKQAPAYVGRGDAYVASGETEENLTAAQADYETAIELDATNAEAYLGLADVYIRQGNYDKALEILKQGSEKTEADSLTQKLHELNKSDETDENISSDDLNTYGVTEFTKRRRYVPYNQLSEELQEAINNIIPALKTQDVNALLSIDALSRDAYEEFYFGYTEWEDYRVYMAEPPTWIPDSPQYRYELEIRPQSGMGYSCYVEYTKHTPTDLWTVRISSCNCTDWRYDGEFQSYWIYENGETGMLSGPMINGYFEGTFVETIPNGAATYYKFSDGVLQSVVSEDENRQKSGQEHLGAYGMVSLGTLVFTSQRGYAMENLFW